MSDEMEKNITDIVFKLALSLMILQAKTQRRRNASIDEI